MTLAPGHPLRPRLRGLRGLLGSALQPLRRSLWTQPVALQRRASTTYPLETTTPPAN